MHCSNECISPARETSGAFDTGQTLIREISREKKSVTAESRVPSVCRPDYLFKGLCISGLGRAKGVHTNLPPFVRAAEIPFDVCTTYFECARENFSAALGGCMTFLWVQRVWGTGGKISS